MVKRKEGSNFSVTARSKNPARVTIELEKVKSKSINCKVRSFL